MSNVVRRDFVPRVTCRDLDDAVMLAASLLTLLWLKAFPDEDIQRVETLIEALKDEARSCAVQDALGENLPELDSLIAERDPIWPAKSL